MGVLSPVHTRDYSCRSFTDMANELSVLFYLTYGYFKAVAARPVPK